MKRAVTTILVCLAALCGKAAVINLSPVADEYSTHPAAGALRWNVDADESALVGVDVSVYSYDNHGNPVWSGWCSLKSTEMSSLQIPSVVCGYYNSMYYEIQVKAVGSTKYVVTRSPFQNLTHVVIDEGVERINGAIFQNCDKLTAVSLPSTLKGIGDYSFGGCDSLNSLALPNSVSEIGRQAFLNCTNLVSVNMPERLVVLGDSAFENTKLRSVNIPTSCEAIGARAFHRCENLQHVLLGECKMIGEDAFHGCVSIETIDFPSTVEEIGARAFYGCSGLREVRFNCGMKVIGNSAFSNCSEISELLLPDGLESIGSSAFWYCTGIEKIYVPASVTNSASPFTGCQPKDVTEGRLWGFYNSDVSITNLTLLPGAVSLEYAGSYVGKALQRVELPNTIKTIPGQMFQQCTNLVEAIIPDSVESVGNYAFSECYKLEELPLLNGSVTNWGRGVFQCCYGAEKLKVPGNMKSIPDYMFYSCTNLKEVVVEEGIETISYSAFAYDDAIETLVLPSTATNLSVSYYSNSKYAQNLKVATFNQKHPPRNVAMAFLRNFTGTAYYPSDYADEWREALGQLAQYGKSWAELDENDPGCIEIDDVRVPYSWLGKYHLTVDGTTPLLAMGALTGKKDSSGRALTAMDDYVAGTDPTNETSLFEAKIEMRDGVPVVAWEPDLNENGTKLERLYKVYGKESLTDSEWAYPTNSFHRFFKVTVEMP